MPWEQQELIPPSVQTEVLEGYLKTGLGYAGRFCTLLIDEGMIIVTAEFKILGRG